MYITVFSLLMFKCIIHLQLYMIQNTNTVSPYFVWRLSLGFVSFPYDAVRVILANGDKRVCGIYVTCSVGLLQLLFNMSDLCSGLRRGGGTEGAWRRGVAAGPSHTHTHRDWWCTIIRLSFPYYLHFHLFRPHFFSL